MKKYKTYFLLQRFCPLFLIIIIFSCSKKNYSARPYYQFTSVNGLPDYSSLNYWASHPFKHDAADSVPKPLRKFYKNDSLADVFFIYPTTLTDYSDQQMNAAIDDAELNAKTDYSSILYQASVFNESCRVFAPRYRQAHYRAFFLSDSVAAPYFNLAYADIKNAFEYYLQHYNNGRPIIIAAHSQGTVHAGRLIKDFFEDKPLQNKLVCAYLIGMPVPDTYFTGLKPCKDAAATGCFVSWRTYKTGYTQPNFIAKEKFKCVVINPLTWSDNTGKAARSLNSGGVLTNFNKIVKGVAGCQVHNNILWSSKPRFFGNIFLTRKNYHIADINLFYVNIRQNVKTRIEEFYKKNKGYQ